MITPSPLTIPGLEIFPKINFGTDLTPQLAEIYHKAFALFSGFDYRGLISDLKTVAIILSVVFGVILVWVFIKIGDLYKDRLKDAIGGAVEGLTPPPEAVTAYDNRWTAPPIASFNLS